MGSTHDWKYDDIIDSQDIIGRIYELEARESADLDVNETQELAMLREVAEEGEDLSSDWVYGATLIRDSYFEDYARELAEDIGAIPKDIAWPCSCIDWARAARELQQDHSSLKIDGITYWVRS